ncbi:MAG: hypothetical protein A3J24_03180 [Deltaproteobacteria bacterium RIFCSPLOWO2_02_FULL_53_8]|nr:MAG: hypothetical protein A3J24_03180 [Deltaproteobacteria bacterium RIFCSPLOWO2_02_FULL_53_8]
MRDYLWVFRKFNENEIKYIVVGGLAVNLHGIPRMTYDLDILLDLDDDANVERFLRLLKEWGFRPRVPVDIMDFADAEKRGSWIKDKNMKAFNLVNSEWALSEIDIIIDTPVNYKEASTDIRHITLKDISVPLISIAGLIKMKEAANRRQDLADIRYLKRIDDEET